MTLPTLRRALRPACFALLLAGVARAPSAAAHPRDDAATHFHAGTELHRQGRFNEAAQEFLVAYRASNRAELLYNAYVAYRDGANIAGAAEALREYLRVERHPRHRSRLQAQLRALEARLPAQPRPAVEPPPAPSPPPVTAPAPVEEPLVAAPTPPPRRTLPAPRPSLVAPAVLLSVGGAAVVTGLVLGLTVANADAELRSACPDGSCDPSLRDTAEGARARAIVTDVLLGLGLASAAVGTVLLATTLGARSRASASAACVPGACGASVRVSF